MKELVPLSEPKIKYFMFAAKKPAAGKTFSDDELAGAKSGASANITELWSWISTDAKSRLGK